MIHPSSLDKHSQTNILMRQVYCSVWINSSLFNGTKICLFNGADINDLVFIIFIVKSLSLATSDATRRSVTFSRHRFVFKHTGGGASTYPRNPLVRCRWALAPWTPSSWSCPPPPFLLVELPGNIEYDMKGEIFMWSVFTCFSKISSKLTSVRPMSLGSVFSTSISPSSTTFSPLTTKTPLGMSP